MISMKNTDLLLHNPKLNKSTASTKQERKKHDLLGRLPYKIETLDQQVVRVYEQFKKSKQKRIFLDKLYNNNQTLFYKLISKHLEEMMPIIYTPQVASACLSFSNEFLWPNGAYISYPDRKNLKKIIDNVIHSNIDVIVVTDGERILGIGDQGVGGIEIAKGKLMLYTLLGSIDPNKTLPIVLDVGTNNKKLLNDPFYLGWRHRRITGEKYLNFIDNFVKTLKRKSPKILLQWEDFANQNAWELLERHRKKICSFNDDIQGTAAVTLAAILAATKTAKLKLSKQPIVFFGAGSAAIGIVKIITVYLKKMGLKEKEILKNIWLINRNGLITDQTKNSKMQEPYLHRVSELKNWQIKNQKHISLLEVVQNVKPTVLLGCSTVANAFNKKIIKEMARYAKQPIIMPLSNPTENAEALPKDLINWTDGKALIATGSPFKSVIYKNRKIEIAQCNNALVFPGIGLGIVVSRAKEVIDEMFLKAAEVLYKKSPRLKNSHSPLLPSVSEIPKISKLIAKKVAALTKPKVDFDKKIKTTTWKPKYDR